MTTQGHIWVIGNLKHNFYSVKLVKKDNFVKVGLDGHQMRQTHMSTVSTCLSEQ